MNSKKLDEAIEALRDDELDNSLADHSKELKKDSDEKEYISAADKRRKEHKIKERLINKDFDGLSPEELLELLLSYGAPKKDAGQISRCLMERFGSIAGVFNADVSALTEVKGMTENAAVLFKLIPQITDIYCSERSKGASYTNTQMLADLFRPLFFGVGVEKFMLACFDKDLTLIRTIEISSGTSEYTSIELRKIMIEVINCGCELAAIAHNHPLNSPKPSCEDIAVTRQINNLFRTVGVTLMDHIIVGGEQIYSMRDGGDLGIFD